jgi:chemotaxis protein methyltransferase CheR
MSHEDETEELEMRLVLQAILEQYGYDLRGYAGDSIRRRLRVALARSRAASFGELQHRLLYDPVFFSEVLNQLTVQVSDMFRDPTLYAAFRQRVVPLLRTYPQFKIWHAGCAAGEEAYSVAIVLHEEQLYDRAQIYATDLSDVAIARAADGVYSSSRAEVFADNYRAAGGAADFAEYFHAAYGRVVLRPELKRNVVCFQHNLASDYALGEMQVIFCRNVLIYFGAELSQRVVTMFSKALPPGGFLVLGGSERIPNALAATFDTFDPEHRIYRLRGVA